MCGLVPARLRRMFLTKCEKVFSDGKREAAKHTSHALSKPNKVGVWEGKERLGNWMGSRESQGSSSRGLSKKGFKMSVWGYVP